jgi:GntR family transcriptional regulator
MALLEFHLDPKSGVSYYVQLIQQVRQALMVGILRSGDQLPTVKEVVARVAVNPNTVLRAYRELEHDGLVVSRPGVGTFIAATVPTAIAPRVYKTLKADLERWIEKARTHGVEDRELAALFAHVLNENADEVVA